MEPQPKRDFSVNNPPTWRQQGRPIIIKGTADTPAGSSPKGDKDGHEGTCEIGSPRCCENQVRISLPRRSTYTTPRALVSVLTCWGFLAYLGAGYIYGLQLCLNKGWLLVESRSVIMGLAMGTRWGIGTSVGEDITLLTPGGLRFASAYHHSFVHMLQ